MDTVADNAPLGWLEILEESEADLAAGRIVSGEDVHRELHDSIAQLGLSRCRGQNVVLQ